MDQEDVEINYRVVIHLNETTSVGTYEMKFIINDESQGSVCTDYNEYSFTLDVVEKSLAQFNYWESQFSMREN